MENSSEKGIALNHFLALNGVDSRRHAADWILAGTVSVNGKICEQCGYRVMPEDVVEVRGVRIGKTVRKRCVLMMNKPRGYECTRPNGFAKRTVFDLFDEGGRRLFTVGRLDKNSEGLLLLTDDGDLAQRLAHPRYEVEKEYRVVVENPLSETDIQTLLTGFTDENEWLQARRVEPVPQKENTYSVILTGGKKREIRRLIQHVRNDVRRLIRLRVGTVSLNHLPCGSVRELTRQELRTLQREIEA